MGLGKTIQVLSILLLLKRHEPGSMHLLVLRASLLGNWNAELARFAPSLRVRTVHPSFATGDELATMKASSLQNTDVVLTTYGTVLRLAWLSEIEWGVVVVDEAQAIKILARS